MSATAMQKYEKHKAMADEYDRQARVLEAVHGHRNTRTVRAQARARKHYNLMVSRGKGAPVHGTAQIMSDN